MLDIGKKQNKTKTVATFRALESCRGKVDCDANDGQRRVTSQLEALCFLRQPLSSCSLGLRVYRRDVFALLISQCCNIQSLNRWEGANSGVRQIGVQILPPLLPSCVTRAGCLLLTKSQYFHPKNGGNFRIYPITRGWEWNEKMYTKGWAGAWHMVSADAVDVTEKLYRIHCPC